MNNFVPTRNGFAVVRMQDHRPSIALIGLLLGKSTVIEPLLVEVIDITVRPGRKGNLGHGIGELMEMRLTGLEAFLHLFAAGNIPDNFDEASVRPAAVPECL